MALIIPRNYHKISDVEKNHISWIEPELAERQDIRPLRIGILNIMPLGKQYEFNLLHPLGLSPLQIEPVWIKLETHSYKTCLLYTSPSPRDLSTSRMPSSA